MITPPGLRWSRADWKNQRSRPEAGHEGGEDDGERPRRLPDLEDEELKPDDLVDQRRGAAGDEQRQERRSRFHQAAGIPSP